MLHDLDMVCPAFHDGAIKNRVLTSALDPPVIKSLLGGVPVFGVWLEQLQNEVLCRISQRAPPRVLQPYSTYNVSKAQRFPVSYTAFT
jgi:hypothetical protein